ncbi:hypothetical protein HanOQP8_Chr13g0506661 [Helianthus annuus]|nr:hypothetical protein HanOQP8_Chr13g0506661 [Helianthus annuus]
MIILESKAFDGVCNFCRIHFHCNFSHLIIDLTLLQLPPFYGFTAPNGELPKFPVMYPVLVPGLAPSQEGQEQTDHGPGLYAVPTFPNTFGGPIAGFPSNTLIPFTYNVPT